MARVERFKESVYETFYFLIYETEKILYTAQKEKKNERKKKKK